MLNLDHCIVETSAELLGKLETISTVLYKDWLLLTSITLPLLAVEVREALVTAVSCLRSLILVMLDLLTCPLAVRLGPDQMTASPSW